MADESLLAAIEKAAGILESRGCRYALTGGAALAAWGRYRTTADADLLLGIDLLSQEKEEELSRIVKALREGGFAHLEGADRRRLEDMTVLHFWFPIRPLGISIRVDLIVMEEEAARPILERAVRRKIDGFQLSVASCEDLVLLKLAAGRPVDLADARALLSIHGDAIDRTYLENRAARMDLSRRLQEALPGA